MTTSPSSASPASDQNAIGFPLIEQMLRELANGKSSPTYDRLVAEPRKKLAAFRQSNGMKGKKECDALELALKRVDELLTLLRTAKITPIEKASS